MKATEQLVHDLKKMYLPQNRFANFGNVLLTLDVNGIRGMSASMSMEFPITVIIGKNGSGKSTLAQLALCCYRYKLPEETHHNMKNYYNLGNFFIKSNLDPNPYTADAYLKYSYAISPESRGFEQMSLFMTTPEASCHARENIIRKIHSDWGGYKHRPDRKCIFAYPTDLPPEKEVFSNPIVAEFLFNQYHVDFMDIRRTAKDHHYYADKISHQCDIDIPTIEVQCIQAYLENQKIEKFSSLLNAIRGTS